MGGLGSVLRVAAKVLVIPVAAVAGAALAALLFSPEPLLPARERTLSDERTVTARETPIPPLLGDRVLRGLVVAPDGRPIANAAVRATAGLVVAETKANEFGRFVIERLPSSPAQLVALADGYRPARVGPIEPGTNDVTVTLSLVAPITTASAPARLPDSRSSRGSLAVTVRAPGGDPAPGLTIAVLPPSQEIDAPIFLPRTAALDDPASPVARIGDLPPGRYPVIAVASGGAVDPHLAFGEATVEIAPGAEVHLDLEVNWATLRGRVT
ncbi:MAG TPA: carboxypeptidase-like regulatory domain-containing protein, partial [Planctomycetota bacterium]|nr:carboxypeptidase-like regulatory domain-containing protein [Planctomycetota bacterium]